MKVREHHITGVFQQAYSFSTPLSRVQQLPRHISRPWAAQRATGSWRPVSSTTPPPGAEGSKTSHSARAASDLDQNISQEEKNDFERRLVEDKSKQIRTPWHREGSETPPVGRQRSAGAMTKGKILTTPTRLFKLVLPLTTRDYNKDRKDVQPLALLVHPSQPLSYLQLLIQAELPTVSKDGTDKPPEVDFLAVDSMHGSLSSQATSEKAEDLDTTEKQKKEEKKQATAEQLDGVEAYSGAGRASPGEAPKSEDFVRWSKSTEIGDFVRDAARGKEFAIDIESAPQEIRVGVPSFGDRTFYLRTRLRKRAKEIARLAKVKKECDFAAYRRGQRIAYAGFAGVVGGGGVVAYVTFMTDAGWDLVEPITYLAGLVAVLIGYGWFLIHNRDASYRSAMNITISKRQYQLYQSRGFDMERWHALIEEGNALRREIKAVANEYDVEWDESMDAQDDTVVEALREERSDEEDDDGGDDGADKKKKKKHKKKNSDG